MFYFYTFLNSILQKCNDRYLVLNTHYELSGFFFTYVLINPKSTPPPTHTALTGTIGLISQMGKLRY